MSRIDNATDEANQLYWESDVSVAEIAERLQLSRRALYEAIVPLPADRSCEDCGGPLTYENRSARTGDNATCEACAAGVADTPPAPSSVEAAPVDARMRVVGAALAGAAVGALVTLVLVPRR